MTSLCGDILTWPDVAGAATVWFSLAFVIVGCYWVYRHYKP